MRSAAALLLLLVLTACSDQSGPEPARKDAVLYTIGVSTDPYGESRPQGFGVATGVLDTLDKVEIREPGLGGFGGADWVDGRRIVVARPAPPLRRPLIYRYAKSLEPEGAAPIPAGATYDWSPVRRLFTYEPVAPCGPGQRSTYACYRGAGRIYVVRIDGTGRRRVADGHLSGWTADGRIAFFRSLKRATLEAFDVETGRTGPILSRWEPALPLPAWSSDRRYVAAVTRNGVLVASATGEALQTIRSKLAISMVAWSPVANRLAFTTSGFPDPHQLFVLARPDAKAHLLYATGDMHFDWITWSPDGKWLLLDEEHMNRWLLLRTDDSGERRIVPRLGGRPLWCCSLNSFLDAR